MPRTEQANQLIREETTRRILDAAMAVFARKGSAATMAEVAAEAGVSQGLAYRYFPSKEAMLTKLVRRAFESGGPLSERVKRAGQTPGERLSRVLASMIDRRRTQPGFYQFFFQTLSSQELPSELREMVERQGKASQDTLRRLIVEGQATGEVADDDPDQLLEAIMSVLAGMTARMALLDPAEIERRLPNSGIILRMLMPEGRRRGGRR